MAAAGRVRPARKDVHFEEMEARREQLSGYTFDRLWEICQKVELNPEGEKKKELIELLSMAEAEAAGSIYTEGTKGDPLLAIVELMYRQLTL